MVRPSAGPRRTPRPTNIPPGPRRRCPTPCSSPRRRRSLSGGAGSDVPRHAPDHPCEHGRIRVGGGRICVTVCPTAGACALPAALVPQLWHPCAPGDLMVPMPVRPVCPNTAALAPPAALVPLLRWPWCPSSIQRLWCPCTNPFSIPPLCRWMMVLLVPTPLVLFEIQHMMPTIALIMDFNAQFHFCLTIIATSQITVVYLAGLLLLIWQVYSTTLTTLLYSVYCTSQCLGSSNCFF